VEVAENAMTGPDDRRRLALDERTEGVRIAGQDGLDRPAGFDIRGRSVGRKGDVGSDRPASG
jgi:hypothetical protein